VKSGWACRTLAVRLLAETEGLILDPVYTASAMACLIDLCRAGRFKKGDTIVFVNTGGQAGLFPYEAPIRAAIEGRDPAVDCAAMASEDVEGL
jgi:threonine synthase